MKRSKVLKQINDYLDQDLNIDMEPEWIEEILNIVEKAGMLPPLNSWSLHTDGDHADPDNILYYTWEEEDENI